MDSFSFHPQLFLRTPLFPLSMDISQEIIEDEMKHRSVSESIYLSSPGLLSKYIEYAQKAKSDKKDSVLSSIRKYIIRMRSRCTPFGTSAQCAVASWAQGTNLQLETNISHFNRRTRLDMQFVCALIEYIESDEYWLKQMKLFPNNTLYKSFDQYRYVEYYFKNIVRYHQITSVSFSEYIEMILERAEFGASFDELVAILCNSEINIAEATGFVTQIIQSQILVTELNPNVTGISVLERVLSFLESNPSNGKINLYKTIKEINLEIKALDARKINGTQDYRKIQDAVSELEIPFDENRLFQVDSFRNLTKNEVSQNVKKQITESIDLLEKLAFHYGHKKLDDFRDRFYGRYEDKEVPLSEVMDTERGIGYVRKHNQLVNNPLINGLQGETPFENKMEWTRLNAFLLTILQEAHFSSRHEIDLARYTKQINTFSKSKKSLPISMSIWFELFESETAEHKLYFKGAYGPCATQLIARFGDGFEPFKKIFSDLVDYEKKYFDSIDVTVAEIAHLPQSRTGNILFRPDIREYEIPYLAYSLKPKEQQLDLDDLMVSVRNEEVILRSKKLGKRVLPRKANAHDHQTNSLPVYNFLADLQLQNINDAVIFSWGAIKNDFIYLPRVTYKDIIINRAEWNFKKTELDKLRKNPVETIKTWKDLYFLHDLVVVSESDNELLIDTREPDYIDLLLNEAKKRDSICLKEFLPQDYKSLLEDTEGKIYGNEFVAFLLNNKFEFRNYRFPNKEHSSIQRKFSPGSEWVYFKIYCGYVTADKIISEYLVKIIEAFESSNIISKWFFIRYQDPDPHIRIRFLVNNKENVGEIITYFNENLEYPLAQGLIHKIQLDTYIREIERYGYETIEDAESIFCLDSRCTANFIKSLQGFDEKYRWLFALISIDSFLTDIELDLVQKIELLERLKNAFAEEFDIGKALKQYINNKYRSSRAVIEELFTIGSEIRDEMEPAIDFLTERSDTFKTQFTIDLEFQKSIGPQLDSFVHMICNRIFISSQRKHELVLYDMLFKYYKSVEMRAKSKAKKSEQMVKAVTA